MSMPFFFSLSLSLCVCVCYIQQKVLSRKHSPWSDAYIVSRDLNRQISGDFVAMARLCKETIMMRYLCVPHCGLSKLRHSQHIQRTRYRGAGGSFENVLSLRRPLVNVKSQVVSVPVAINRELRTIEPTLHPRLSHYGQHSYPDSRWKPEVRALNARRD
jgi:hypothetical protein